MRAKTINEIKRSTEDKVLRTMNTGVKSAFPALAYMRELCPDCLTKETLLDRIMRFSDRTTNRYALKTYVDKFEKAVGDPADFSIMDFKLTFGEEMMYKYGAEKDEMYDEYFSGQSRKADDMEEIFDDSLYDEDNNPRESYRCKYNFKEGIGSMDMSNERGRAYLSCYFVKSR